MRTYQLTPEQLERLRNGESLDDILKGESEVTKQKIDWLKREVIHAHKLLTEKEQECEQLKQEVERWKEFWADATRELRALRLYALQKLQKDVYES
ncbi:hypothetical protein [Geobacillus subterraneus]|uniref:Uncharacterized protein n=1 Tax=Geobacillus subterraneus TaxID=129338 RepID=A0A679G4P9_9BACL|nr:hypothetical protein [Geobacillus subterraneus]BBW99031.1 hypothetical protein GsuE55_38640 [Geobacillus subterraneus]